MRRDGSHVRRLTHTNGDAETPRDSAGPDWSPDGHTIVFTTNRRGKLELWMMKPDGSGQRPLVGLPYRDDGAPKFSPDGMQIAFESRSQTESSIYLVRANGRGVRKLLDNAYEPSWRR